MRFGFVRFRMIKDAIEIRKRMNGRWLCGSMVHINIARFERPFQTNSKKHLRGRNREDSRLAR